jgi:transposase-like protein
VRHSRFSVEQIIAVLKQAELGMPIPELIRKVGISEQTFYRWKKQYGGLQPDQARELKQLQEENARLKKLVADLSLDKAILQDVAKEKRVGRPALRRLAVDYVTSHWNVSQRRACRLVGQPRSNQAYASRKDPRHDLRQRMREIATTAACATGLPARARPAAPRGLDARTQSGLPDLQRGAVAAALEAAQAPQDGRHAAATCATDARRRSLDDA